MTTSLEGIGLIDLLASDPRPSFIIASPDLEKPSVSSSQPDEQPHTANHNVIYKNPALINNITLTNSLHTNNNDDTHLQFWDWVNNTCTTTTTSSHDNHDTQPSDIHSLSYVGVYWTRNVVPGKCIIVSGNEIPPSVEPPRKIRLEASRDIGVAKTSHTEAPSTQILDFAPQEKQGEAAKTPTLFRVETDPGLKLPDFTSDSEPFLHIVHSVDWDNHKLGPMDEWPVRLQQVFPQILPDSRAIAIYWGPDYLALYNEAFSKFCGSHHPNLLGRPVLEIWAHLKEHLDQLWNAPTNIITKIDEESRFFVEKTDGSVEETYIKWALTPVIENRACVGIEHSLLETTSMRLWERRMKFLIDLGEALVTARDVQSYWAKTIEELEKWNPDYDVPLAFIYSVDEDSDGDSSQSRYDCPRTCRLAGTLGVPADHVIAPSVLELRDTDQGLAPSFREALHTQIALHVRTDDGTLPERLLEGLEWRGFGDPCQEAVILPIRPTKDENIMGLLFLGLNPRRAYDNEYRQFISLLNQKLTSSLASTVLLEEEARRGRNAAAQAAFDTEMLQRKLAWQTEQANKSLQNFQAVCEFIPVGMSFTDNHGNVTFANDAWYRITGYPRGPIAPGALLQCVCPDDKKKIERAYEDLNKVDVVTVEFRIPKDDTSSSVNGENRRTGSIAGMDDRVERYVLGSTKAERSEDGSVVRMLTCLTDVTEQKDTAEEALRRAQEAQNLKRLAEFATVGMYDISLEGRLLSANDSFWELSGLTKVDLSKIGLEPFETCVAVEDLPILQEKLNQLRATGAQQTADLRLKTTWTAEDASGKTIVAPRSVLATFMPVKSSDGIMQSFTGCISDVSMQKWQLEQERLRKDEAIESKRQQENFIDMTSHEMRNPLSAIIHCTDAIVVSLTRVEEIREVDGNEAGGEDEKNGEQQPSNGDMDGANDGGFHESRKTVEKLLKDSIENAETILTCAQHQKRIVDDILTMSKLDSKLLAVTPCTVNPVLIVTDALKMFDVEARRTDIRLTKDIDKSYNDLNYEYLDLDPSRVQQVLINLLTNALKFTKTGKVRNVTICVKGSLTRPDKEMTPVNFVPRFQDVADDYEQPALKGRTNPVYLMFEVKDTGQGLTEGETRGLFNKFVQASAKTHVKYGGSGLGLFISRRLTELQNGAIGVSSQIGVGSIFGFYIEAYVPSQAALVEAEAAAAAAKLISSTESVGLSSSPDGSGWRGSLMKRLHPGSSHVRLDSILVVEDNLINQQITRRGLLERGYSVDVANHGIEALEKLRCSMQPRTRLTGINIPTSSTRPSSPSPSLTIPINNSNSAPIPVNLVLMDIEMPIQDGLTCTRKIRDLEASGEVFCASGGRIPIIAVTANARPEQITDAKRAGCDDVLVKPYRIPELVEKMQAVVRRVSGMSPNSPAS